MSSSQAGLVARGARPGVTLAASREVTAGRRLALVGPLQAEHRRGRRGGARRTGGGRRGGRRRPSGRRVGRGRGGGTTTVALARRLRSLGLARLALRHRSRGRRRLGRDLPPRLDPAFDAEDLHATILVLDDEDVVTGTLALRLPQPYGGLGVRLVAQHLERQERTLGGSRDVRHLDVLMVHQQRVVVVPPQLRVVEQATRQGVHPLFVVRLDLDQASRHQVGRHARRIHARVVLHEPDELPPSFLGFTRETRVGVHAEVALADLPILPGEPVHLPSRDAHLRITARGRVTSCGTVRDGRAGRGGTVATAAVVRGLSLVVQLLAGCLLLLVLLGARRADRVVAPDGVDVQIVTLVHDLLELLAGDRIGRTGGGGRRHRGRRRALRLGGAGGHGAGRLLVAATTVLGRRHEGADQDDDDEDHRRDEAISSGHGCPSWFWRLANIDTTA